MPSWPGAGRSPRSRSGVSGGLPAAAGAAGARDADGGRRTAGRRRSGPGRGRPRGCGVACYRWRGPPCRRSSCPSPESCPFSVLVPWDWIGLRRRSQYLEELLQEQQKLGPFVQVLPICGRLLNQEIMRISSMLSHLGVRGNERLPPIASPNHMPPVPRVPNFCGNGFGPWNGMHPERNGVPRGAMGWQGAAQNHSSYIVKKIVRLEVPTDAYPNFNFIGRLLGPRGHSLKRVEATTGCRVFIRGKGSIKDPVKEEQLKGRPGYKHLGDPTHILIEAELPADVIDAKLAQAQEILEELLKPVDESQDNIKRQQLRELAMLNSVYREDSPHQNGSASPFSNGGTKQ